MQFAHLEYLYLLIFVPIFFILLIVRINANDRLLLSYIKSSCLKVNTGFVSRRRKIIRYFIFLMIFLFLILALARPQSQMANKEITIKGSEVMILADVSKSMLVEDIGGFSRFSVLQKELDGLIQLLAGQRVGLISFSGAATLVSPLTLDHSALRLFLKSLSPSSPVLQGTNFSSAFRAADQALKRGGVLDPTKPVSKVIVVASDGEDNEGKSLQIAQELYDQKIRIFTLGFGTKKGGKIPIYDKSGRKLAYKRDKKGQFVISQFKEDFLKQIARVTDGAFYSISPGGGNIKKVYSDIQAIGKSSFSYQSQNAKKEWYQYFVAIALFLSTLFFLIGERKKGSANIWHSYLEKKEEV